MDRSESSLRSAARELASWSLHLLERGQRARERADAARAEARRRRERGQILAEWGRRPRGPHLRLTELVLALERLADALEQHPRWDAIVMGDPRLADAEAEGLLAASEIQISLEAGSAPGLEDLATALRARDQMAVALGSLGPLTPHVA